MNRLRLPKFFIRFLPGTSFSLTVPGDGSCAEAKVAPFPLTPALSPGERENSSAPSKESNALPHPDPFAHSCALLPTQPDCGIEAEDVQVSKTDGNGLPLPGGEGWGEGETDVPTTGRVPIVAGWGGLPEGSCSFEPFFFSSFPFCRTSLTELALTVFACGIVSSASAAPVNDRVTYDDHVVPILRNHCFTCHNSDKKKADLDLSTFNGIMAGGGSGKVLAAQDSSGSLLWKLINHLEEPNMPPKKPMIPDGERAVIKQWIEGGLLERTGSKAIASQKSKVDLTLKATSTGKPDGPPPMPNGDLLIEPVVRAARPGAITALAASPWAPLAAVAGQKQVILYNLDTLAVEGILPFPEGFPYVLKFSRSGRLLLAGGGVGAKLGKVVLFDVVTGKRVAEVGDEYDAVLAADLTPDQTQIALGGPSKLVRIYSIATGELLQTIKKHTEWVTAIAYSPDGVLLATGDRNGGVHVWESATALPYSELKAHQQCVTDIAWRDDSNLAATTGEDSQIMLWELENSSRVRNWSAHGGGSQAVRFSHDGRLVSTGRDRTTKLWDGNGGQQRAFEAFGDIALVAAISHDTTKVIAGDFTGEVRVWNAADGKLLGKLDANPPTLAERIEADNKRVLEAKMDHEKMAAAHASARDAMNKAGVILENARQSTATADAASKAAEAALTSAKQASTQAATAQDSSQKEAQSKQNELEGKIAVLASAQQTLSQLQSGVKPTQEAVAAAAAAEKAAAEAHAKVKAASDATPSDPQLVAAATQAKAAADQASVALLALQKGIAGIASRLKTGEAATQDAQTAAARAKTAHDAAQTSVAELTAVLAGGEAKLKTATEARQKAMAAAAAAAQAVPPAEARVKAADDTQARAKAQLDGSAAQLAAMEKDLARWKAGQFNLQVLAAAEELEKKESASQAALAQAENLKATADRTAAELAAVQKAIAEAPGLINAKTQAVHHARATLDAANAAVPNLKNDLAVKQTNAVAKSAALKTAGDALARAQQVLKAVQETTASAEGSARSGAETAAKAKAAAESAPEVPLLSEAAAKARQAAKESADTLEAARKAVTEMGSQVTRLTGAQGQAKAAADEANQAALVSQQSLDKQMAAIKEAEAGVNAANDSLAKAKTMADELPKKLALLEPAVSQSAAAAAAARESAGKAAAAVTPLKEKHEQLVAKYQKIKPKGG